jgi:hypothetical protein
VQDDDLEDEVELSDDDEDDTGRDIDEEDDEEDEDGGTAHRKKKQKIKRNKFIDDVADVDDDEEDDDEDYDDEAAPGEKFIEEDGGEVPRDHLAFRRRAMEEEKMLEVEDEEAVNEYYRQKDRQVHYMVCALLTGCEVVHLSRLLRCALFCTT